MKFSNALSEQQSTDKNIRFNEYNIRVETVTLKSWQSRMDLT